jgi:hypothetical protein
MMHIGWGSACLRIAEASISVVASHVTQGHLLLLAVTAA